MCIDGLSFTCVHYSILLWICLFVNFCLKWILGSVTAEFPLYFKISSNLTSDLDFGKLLCHCPYQSPKQQQIWTSLQSHRHVLRWCVRAESAVLCVVLGSGAASGLHPRGKRPYSRTWKLPHALCPTPTNSPGELKHLDAIALSGCCQSHSVTTVILSCM